MTNQVSDYTRERIEQGLPLVPQHMHDGIRRYFFEGIEPGSFLTAVLENNLMEALGRADDENRSALPAYGTFLYNYVPSGSYGSPAKVATWLNSFVTTETETA